MPSSHRAFLSERPAAVAEGLLFVAALVLSGLMHAGAAAPWVAWSWLTRDLDTPGDGGPLDAPVGNDGGELLAPMVPVQISLYTPSPAPTKGPGREARAAPLEAPQEAPPLAEEAQPSTREERQAAVLEERRAKKEGLAGKPPRGEKRPCEPVEEIVQLGENRWQVERDLVDWYATHLGELDKQAGVATHRDPDGKRDGARLYLPRCSVLKQAGLKNGDIVRSVDGHKVYTIPQAIQTYLAVRNDRTVNVELTRKDGEERTHTYKLK